MPTRILGLLLLAFAAAGCGDEKPDQQFVQSEDRAAARDQRAVEDERRQRTIVGQNEGSRIYSGGALR